MNIKHLIQSKLHRYYKNSEIADHQLKYLFLEITRRCNLNCLHCGSDCRDAPTASLTTDSWIKIIHYISKTFSSDVAFVLTGGEPLLHPDLELIGKTITNLGMRWGMVSNGMALNEKKLESLIGSGIYSITLSLDGPKEQHNKLRNHPFAFDRILKALELIGKSDIEFKDAVTCVYPDNLNQLDDIAKILIEKGIKSWRLFRIFPAGRAKNNTQLLLSYYQTWEMLNWIKSNRKKYKEKGLSVGLSCEGWVPFDIDRKLRDNPFFCRSGINIASILADGTITGCSNNDASFNQGNILKDDFITVWKNKFKEFRERKWIENTTCQNCNKLKDCLGGSIHLWELGKNKPEFCYYKDFSR